MDIIQAVRMMKGIDDLEASALFTINGGGAIRATHGHGMKS